MRTFSPQATHTDLCPTRADIFRLSGYFPTCEPNPDARGPILFIFTLGGLLVASASRVDCFSTSVPFALCIDLFFHKRTSARHTRPFPFSLTFDPYNAWSKTSSRTNRFIPKACRPFASQADLSASRADCFFVANGVFKRADFFHHNMRTYSWRTQTDQIHWDFSFIRTPSGPFLVIRTTRADQYLRLQTFH